MTKKDLLENIRDYSPQEIAVAIRNGVVSFYDLKRGTHGQFSPMMQRKVQELLNTDENAEQNVPAEQTQIVPNVNEPVINEPETNKPIAEEAVVNPPAVNKPDVNETVVNQPVTSHKEEHEQQPEVIVLSEAHDMPANGDADVPPVVFELKDQPLRFETYNQAVPPVSERTIITPPNPSKICPECGYQLSDDAVECPNCGMPLNGDSKSGKSNMKPPKPQETNHVQGVNEMLGTPPNLKSFNWGGFVFGWLWAVFNGIFYPLVNLIVCIFVIVVYIVQLIHGTSEFFEGGGLAILLFGLVVNFLVVRFNLGFKGYEMAWKSKRYTSVQNFVMSQNTWRNVSIVVFILSMVLLILTLIIVGAGVYISEYL